MIEKNRLISSTSLKLLSIDNITISHQTDDSVEYLVEAILSVAYTFIGGGSTQENMNIQCSILFCQSVRLYNKTIYWVQHL